MVALDIEVERARQRCGTHGVKLTSGCGGCRAYRRWERASQRSGAAGNWPSTRPARAHVRALLAEHLTISDIARAAEVSDSTIHRLLATGKKRQRRIRPELSARIMAVRVEQVPLATRDRVDATGTRRRLLCMRLRRFHASAIGQLLHYHPTTVNTWARLQFVPGEAAAAVRDLYTRTLDEIGPAPARVATNARAAGGLPDRMWTAENIDDPGYEPLRVLDEPVGVRRRLRALARDGHGAAAVAATIGEDAAAVEAWTLDGPVPAYAAPLVCGAFEQLAEPGDDQEATDRAIHHGWVSALEWYGANIDDPARGPRADRWRRARTDVDPDYVNGALSGHVPRAELTQAELIEVVRRLGRTMTGREIAKHLQWNADGDADRGEAAVVSFASNHGGIALRDSEVRRAARTRRHQPAVIAA